jgi:hypothetical protein
MKFGKYELNEHPHPTGSDRGIQCKIIFDNGYGASIVRFGFPFREGELVGSYGVNQGLWELAVIKGDIDDFELVYDTPITNDVLGYLSEDEVGEILARIEEL